MVLHALRRDRVIAVARGLRQDEVLRDEILQYETRRPPRRVVARFDRGSGACRSRVHKLLRVRKDSRKLDVGEERADVVSWIVGRWAVGMGRWAASCHYQQQN